MKRYCVCQSFHVPCNTFILEILSSVMCSPGTLLRPTVSRVGVTFSLSTLYTVSHQYINRGHKMLAAVRMQFYIC